MDTRHGNGSVLYFGIFGFTKDVAKTGRMKVSTSHSGLSHILTRRDESWCRLCATCSKFKMIRVENLPYSY